MIGCLSTYCYDEVSTVSPIIINYLIHFLNVVQITGANNGLSMHTFEINSQLQHIDLRMQI
jgi:hypothetical protein